MAWRVRPSSSRLGKDAAESCGVSGAGVTHGVERRAAARPAHLPCRCSAGQMLPIWHDGMKAWMVWSSGNGEQVVW